MPDPLDKKPPIISRWGPDPELFYDIPDAAPDPQAERIKELEAENHELKTAFRKFAQHSPGCNIPTRARSKVNGKWEWLLCNCGLDFSLAQAAPKSTKKG